MSANTQTTLLLPDHEATAKTLATILAKDIEHGLLCLIEDGHEREARAFREIVSAPSWSASWNTLFWGFAEAWREDRESYAARVRVLCERKSERDAFLRSRGIHPVEEHEFYLKRSIGRIVALRAASERER